MKWVMDRILDLIPAEGQKDMRVTMMKTFMYESLKDLARIPDRVFLPLVAEIEQAMNFVVNGSMEELNAYLESQDTEV